MKSVLLGATVLMGLSAPAWADPINNIRIDATSNAGKVTTLSITQDDHNLGNQVSGGADGTTALPIAGPWDKVSIDQQGGNNKLYGAVKAKTGSTTASLTASYAGGNNSHSLTIGSVTAPANPTVQIAVTNTGGGSNTIIDTLDGTALTYNLALTGTGNSLTNAVSATGAITLNQGGLGGYGVTGNNNTIGNTVSGVTSFTHNLTLGGSGNTIANTAINGGDKTITQNIASDGNTVSMTLDAAGSQNSSLTVDSGSKVNYTLLATAVGGAQTINLSNVIGAASAPAVINVTQTASAPGATANLTVAGGLYTMGATLPGGAGVNVYQNSPAAYVNTAVTANANGYTVNITQ
jgi:hypothetical protein